MTKSHFCLRLNFFLQKVASFAFSYLLLTSIACQAATISLQTTSNVKVKDTTATLQLTINNIGNEKASDISYSAKLLSQRQEKHGLGDIPPGRSITTSAALQIPENYRGKIPIYITISYRHQNGKQKSQTILALAQTGHSAHQPQLSLSAINNSQNNGITISVESPDLKERLVNLTSYGPEGFTITPNKAQVNLDNGLNTVNFSITPSASVSESTSFKLYWIAEYTTDEGFQETIYTTSPFTYNPSNKDQSHNLTYYFHLISISLGALAFILVTLRYLLDRKAKSSINTPSFSSDIFIDATVICAVLSSLLTVLPLSEMVSQTLTTGGDTASHYYTLQYLVDTLLPNGQISGWTMGNYAGFPILQFYFPLPFLMMKLFSIFIPLTVSFKMVSILGIFILPICVYIMLRDLRVPFPGPALGGTLSLLFLYHPANSMWGGNILSTLAGEFTYSISMSLSLLLMGSIYRGAINNSRIILNAVLIFLVGFSHGYPLLFVEAISLFLMISPKHFSQRFFYLLKTYALGFLLLAFWLVPLLFFGKFTTPYHTIWQINSWQEFVPLILLPPIVVGCILSILLILLRKRLHKGEINCTLYLWFAVIVAAVLYYIGPAIGLVDIRFVPFGQLIAVIISAATVSFLCRYLKNNNLAISMFIILLIPFILLWANNHQGNIPAWTKWNYSGFEEKPSWPLFEKINKSLSGDVTQPRVAVENSQEHNSFGTSRAFESLPLFAGRSTLEGLYMQASPNAPFIFYLQSLISKESSRPFPQYRYDEMDFVRAKPRLALFNVRDLIIRSEQAKSAISQTAGYFRQEVFDPYEIWRIKDINQRYVVPVNFEPIFYKGKDIKSAAFKWFTRDLNLDIPLVFPQTGQTIPVGVKLVSNLPQSLPRHNVTLSPCTISEKINPQSIDITTDCQDRPLMIKVSYHPNWQVDGADDIYQVTPSFMLIYPKSKNIRLTYKNGKVDYIGAFLSGLGIIILVINLPIAWINSFRLRITDKLQKLENNFHLPTRIRQFVTKPMIILLTVIFSTSLTVFMFFSLDGVLQKNPQRLFEAGIIDKDAKRYDNARKKFNEVIQAQPLSDMARNATYYIAACYYLQGLDSEATASFNKIIESDKHSPWRASAYYHLGVLSLKHNDINSARSYLDIVIKNFPKSGVADSAKEKRQAL